MIEKLADIAVNYFSIHSPFFFFFTFTIGNMGNIVIIERFELGLGVTLRRS